MIDIKNIKLYKGSSLSRDDKNINIAPHELLKPYISYYTLCSVTDMPDESTILPSASARLTFSVDSRGIYDGIIGVNTKASQVGCYANKMEIMLLIEFHAGGILPFIKHQQHEIINMSFALSEIDKNLAAIIKTELLKNESLEDLIIALNNIFLKRLVDINDIKLITAIKNQILIQKGKVDIKTLSAEFYYSEKQIRRLSLLHFGISPKTFSRIVRINHALRLIKNDVKAVLADTAISAGFFDQPHFIRDFKEVCGVTPLEYIKNMSVFYNDEFKI